MAINGIMIVVFYDTDQWKKYNNTWSPINTFAPGENAVLYNYESIEFLSINNGLHVVEFEEISGTGMIMATITKKVSGVQDD